MSGHPYSAFSGDDKQEMILRDHLAVDRTIMANETSFLAYIRTALTLAVAGVTLLKLFGDVYTSIIGWVFLGLSALLFINGAIRYEEMDGVLQQMSQQQDIADEYNERSGVFRRLATAGSTIVHIFYK
jgi:inner membrane protein YidH